MGKQAGTTPKPSPIPSGGAGTEDGSSRTSKGTKYALVPKFRMTGGVGTGQTNRGNGILMLHGSIQCREREGLRIAVVQWLLEPAWGGPTKAGNMERLESFLVRFLLLYPVAALSFNDGT